MSAYADRLQSMGTLCWRTGGARFYAARRLQLEERTATLSVAALTIVIIAISLLDALRAGPFESHAGVTASVMIAFISIFVLVISVVDAHSHRELRAHRLHESGVKFGEIRGAIEDLIARYKSTELVDWDQSESLRQRYEREIRECPFNHQPIDDARFNAQHRSSPEFVDSTGRPKLGWWRGISVRLLHFGSSVWLPMMLWVIVIILIFTVLPQPTTAENHATLR